MQRRKLELSGLEDLFEAVVVSGEHGIHKPDPAIFKIACDKMGVLPEEVIFVGDTFSTDIYGAVLSGMKTVFLHSDILHKTKLDMPMIHSIEELPDIL
jgi:putative hydrolase of the HAD superfamily